MSTEYGKIFKNVRNKTRIITAKHNNLVYKLINNQKNNFYGIIYPSQRNADSLLLFAILYLI